MVKETLTKRAGMPETTPEGSRRNLRGAGSGASSATARKGNFCPEAEKMMEAVVERKNMIKAYKRVVSNKGVAGVDGMSTEELKPTVNLFCPI